MATSANVPSTTTATPGPYWFEFTNAANIALNASGTNTGATVVTIGLPTTGAGSYLGSNLNIPIACVALNQTNIPGSVGTGLLANIGIANAVITNSTTMTITFINSGAASNVNVNTRFLCFAGSGV